MNPYRAGGARMARVIPQPKARVKRHEGRLEVRSDERVGGGDGGSAEPSGPSRQATFRNTGAPVTAELEPPRAARASRFEFRPSQTIARSVAWVTATATARGVGAVLVP